MTKAPEVVELPEPLVVAGERFGRGASVPTASVIEFSFRGEA
jgi:hypothetical protein